MSLSHSSSSSSNNSSSGSGSGGGSSGSGSGGKGNTEIRCGMIDTESCRLLYDRTIGCQIRTCREMKEDQVMMTVPQSIMITPDIIAASDAGKAALACCSPDATIGNYWDAFGSLVEKEKKICQSVGSTSGTQLLVKILQERKKAESMMNQAIRKVQEATQRNTNNNTNSTTAVATAATAAASTSNTTPGSTNGMPEYTLSKKGTISARAAYLLFFIHQRFSNEKSPSVSVDDLEFICNKKDACTSYPPPPISSDTPTTFAPYVRTLPPLVPIPLSWKRNEFALLANCPSGVPLLQEVYTQIMSLSSDLTALVDAGILYRFPSLFQEGMLTWDRWIWAASVFTSRMLPSSYYFNIVKDGGSSSSGSAAGGGVRYSSPIVWNEMGVFIPLLDMVNHDCETNQIMWDKPQDDAMMIDEQDDAEEEEQEVYGKILLKKRIKKGSQVYTNYGSNSNQDMMLRYGFAQISNEYDIVPISWGLSNCVGKVSPPPDYVELEMNKDGKVESKSSDNTTSTTKDPLSAYESNNTEAINAWWTKSRLSLLERTIRSNDRFWENLKEGKKMTVTAHCDGTLNPILLRTVVVATMSPANVEKHFKEESSSSKEKNNSSNKEPLAITKQHLQRIRKYLLFLFSTKYQKVMNGFNDGLKVHYNSVELWTKTTHGGLSYQNPKATGKPEEDIKNGPVGWRFFFDYYAYLTSMEVEKHFYALSPESCVLSLYDGHLRSLEASMDKVLSPTKFEEDVLKEIKSLGFVTSDENDEVIVEASSSANKTAPKEKAAPAIKKDIPSSGEKSEAKPASSSGGGSSSNSKREESKRSDQAKEEKEKQDNAAKADSGRDRNRNRRNRKRNGPPALKLHIGNLSYKTPPADLFEYFVRRYGRHNVLECHIPTERETGKSRGFGFVTMPEGAALQVLQAGMPHEIDGRVVKIAESNTTGGNRGNPNNTFPPADRFPPMGMPMMGGGMPLAQYPPGPCPDDMYGPLPPNNGMDMHDRHGMHWGGGGAAGGGGGGGNMEPPPRGGGGRHRSRSRNRRSYSRSPSPRYRKDDRYYDRSRDRMRRSYSRSRSVSVSRDRRDRDRRRSDRRNGRRSRYRSSRYRSESRSISRSRTRSRSRSRSRSPRSPSYSPHSSSRRSERSERSERERERKSASGNLNMEGGKSQSRGGGGGRSRSRSPSMSISPTREIKSETKKREGVKRRHRSRSRERHSRGRKRSSKSSRKIRSKDRVKRHESMSRSQSR